jgi:hypothetical protein
MPESKIPMGWAEGGILGGVRIFLKVGWPANMPLGLEMYRKNKRGKLTNRRMYGWLINFPKKYFSAVQQSGCAAGFVQ